MREKGQFKTTSRISGLDGLRGFASTLVLLAHMSAWGYNLFPGFDLRGIGRSGVILFFVLSSFLLSSQILNWSPNQFLKLSPWLSYFKARILRIWPLFIFVTAFSLLTSHLDEIPIVWRAAPLLRQLPVTMTWDSFLDHLLLRQGEDILWTIPVEFKFYILLPLLLIAILIPLRNHITIAILVLGALILTSFWLMPVSDFGIDTFPFIGVFLTGILLAFVWHYHTDHTNKGRFVQISYELFAWLCFLIFVSLIPSVYYSISDRKMEISSVNLNSLYSSIWAVMIFCMLRGSGMMRIIFDSDLLVFLGKISFSLYLWHRVPINLMSRLTHFHYLDWLPHWTKGGIIFLVSIGIAQISYAIIERPILLWRAR